MKDILIVGYGGHAKSIIDSIERQCKYRIVGYVDIESKDTPYPYLGTDAELQKIYNMGIENAVVGIGYMGKGNVREKLYKKLKEIGFSLPIIIDSSAIVSDKVSIGEGTFVGKGAVVNAEAVVGKMVIINTKAVIEHECKIGDFCHVAVSAVLCGQVEVEASAFIGANATIIQCKKIESRKLIPAGMTIR